MDQSYNGTERVTFLLNQNLFILVQHITITPDSLSVSGVKSKNRSNYQIDVFMITLFMQVDNLAEK